ncbi:hypothetical protein [Paenibacillus tyrfis]|uniref:hypothetical protein n=1 Tax=Paenibacillus tyrfis TaxID=1501230 RepID=UPI0020A00154|nr:hypothetical protein [Paenibacillus tyrfis]MCP1305942.1 hypothetical protein [Paenibacillus tyrfis]
MIEKEVKRPIGTMQIAVNGSSFATSHFYSLISLPQESDQILNKPFLIKGC